MKTAFITGIPGQDSACLSRHPLYRGYRVVGLLRPGTTRETAAAGLAWSGIAAEVELVWGGLSDGDEGPMEIRRVVGDWSKAKSRLGWAPETSLEDTTAERVGADLARLSP